jgi:sulfoacetaldehyde dehydrogenase
VIAQGTDALASVFDLPAGAARSTFVMLEETGIGPAYPLSGEKLSLVLTVYRAADFEDAARITRAILDYQGRGHSCGIHTRDMAHARTLAETTDVVRVLVNQAHTFGNGGGFDNGLAFTLTMGCGTWQGNAISDNLNWRCFVNITHLVDDPRGQAERGGAVRAYWKSTGAASPAGFRRFPGEGGTSG